jgi:actin-like ATPase involved in cell morphogenesis
VVVTAQVINLTEDKGLTVYDNTLGVKLGSKWTVSYGVPVGERPRIELTCLRKVPKELLKPEDYKFAFSTDAEAYHNAVFPLLHGAPRNDAAMSLSDSCLYIKEFATWLLKDIPANTGIVFCLPMIEYAEGLEALKHTLRQLQQGKVGIEFMGEAWAAALGVLPIQDALDTQVLSINFGSSTLETIFFSGIDEIDKAVWTFGGSNIDRRLMNAIEMGYRGLSATENQARQIKEQYNYTTNDGVFAELSGDDGLKQDTIKGVTIRKIVDSYINDVTMKIKGFLRETRTSNLVATNALQIEGKGYLALVGGMTNMPGFTDAVYNNLVDSGAISSRIKMVSPVDGVVAPAIGAWKAANLLEHDRVVESVSNWSDLS